ncbi:hypothetical protein [Amycolatopsis rubida]|uniref:hypothetical protein n=1 Tax=Amycolatopsis rubida TaxID=112413 RepID=UPI0011602F12|nr:hypothetical protein [Amycolatopsis rubida]
MIDWPSASVKWASRTQPRRLPDVHATGGGNAKGPAVLNCSPQVGCSLTTTIGDNPFSTSSTASTAAQAIGPELAAARRDDVLAATERHLVPERHAALWSAACPEEIATATVGDLPRGLPRSSLFEAAMREFDVLKPNETPSQDSISHCSCRANRSGIGLKPRT